MKFSDYSLYPILIMIITVLFMITPCDSIASPVSVETSGNAAVIWMSERTSMDPGSLHFEKADSVKPAWYNFLHIYNFKPQGFIIISGDDRLFPVIFYSKEGKFTGKNIPPQLAAILDNISVNIKESARTQKVPSKKIRDEWERLSNNSDNQKTRIQLNSVSPLIKTKWDQGKYYNEFCPVDSSGPDDHALVGCVAVTMGQVMKYYNYPTRGNGSNSYSHPDYGTISANFEDAIYDWANMPDSLTSSNAEVAKVLFHLGVSVDMHFGPYESWIYTSDIKKVINAMEDHFYYPSGIKHVERKDYSDDKWLNLMKSEIDAKRPVGYGGGSYSGGHAFILDGYEDSYHFHVNWGWGGQYDGYFYLDDLTPGSHSFKLEQSAMIIPSGFDDDFYEENNKRSEAWYPGRSWENQWLSEIYGMGIQNDEDWFRIDVSSDNDKLNVECHFSHSEGNIDMEIYNSEGDKVAESKSETDNENVYCSAPGAATYYIRIYRGNDGNSYDLRWQGIPKATPTPTPTPVPNDKIVKHILGQENIQPGEIKFADINSDGKINIADIISQCSTQ
jgi:peptidase C10-like protein/Spi protease inhibitor